MKLTPKQETFCLEYIKAGNASEAYRLAFPKSRNWKPETVHKRASELLTNGEVLGRIEELRKAVADEAIADAKARQRWWTKVMRDETADMKDRLKASELLAKAQGDFIERREIQAEVTRITGFEVVLGEMEKRADAGLAAGIRGTEP